MLLCDHVTKAAKRYLELTETAVESGVQQRVLPQALTRCHTAPVMAFVATVASRHRRHNNPREANDPASPLP